MFAQTRFSSGVEASEDKAMGSTRCLAGGVGEVRCTSLLDV